MTKNSHHSPALIDLRPGCRRSTSLEHNFLQPLRRADSKKRERYRMTSAIRLGTTASDSHRRLYDVARTAELRAVAGGRCDDMHRLSASKK